MGTTLEDIIDKKLELERAISGLVRRFHNATTLTIDSLELSTYPANCPKVTVKVSLP